MQTSIRGIIAASLLATSAIIATPAFAQGEEAAPAPDANANPITVTGSVALVTDYRFRGVSQTDGEPAIQGSITVSHKSGFYASVWSSSLNNLGPVYGSQEVDISGGWTGEVSPGLVLDAGLLYYMYPSGKLGNAEFFEPYASISGTYGPAKLKAGVTYAWKQKALQDYKGKDDNLYVFGNADIGIPSTPLTFSGHVGYQSGPLTGNALLTFGSLNNKISGFDWSAGVSATVLGKISVGVAYIGTQSISVKNFTDDAIVGTLSVAF